MNVAAPPPGPAIDHGTSVAGRYVSFAGCPITGGRIPTSTSTIKLNVSINIKNPETCRLARQLATMTGETMTRAMTVALRERLIRETRTRSAEPVARELEVIGERCARLLEPGPSAVEHDDFLYDDRGLPK